MNATRGVSGVVRAWILGACVLGPCVRATGQGEPPAREPSTAREQMGAYEAVEAWVRAGTVGESPAELRGFAGAAVTLRAEGAVIGRGVALSAEDAGPGEGVVRGAAKRAIEEAAARFGPGTDALQRERAPELWARVMVSVELMDAMTPLSCATYDEVDAEVAAGVEGVAARSGTRVEAVFPATMLARGMTPGDALGSAISRAAGEPGIALREDPNGQPGKLAERRGMTFYRFGAVHIAQTAPGSPAVFLHRGGRVVPMTAMTREGMGEWCGSMARHLAARRRVIDGVVTYGGTYQPVTGVMEGPGESAFEEVLCAAALLTAAETPGIEAGAAGIAGRAADEIVSALAERRSGVPEADVASAALWACVVPRMAARRGWGAVDASAWPEAWKASLARSVEVLERVGARPGDVSAGERAVAAYALARRAGEGWAGEGGREAARAALGMIYGSSAPGELAASMPWLGWAEMRLAGEMPGAAALRELRATVYGHEVRAGAVRAQNVDMSGGLVFTSGRGALPTWQTARVAAFLVSAVGDERLTDREERAREMYRVVEVLRFLRQLTADGATGFMYADAGRAAGGVRVALWDQRQPVDATALTLIAACEAVRVSRGEGARGGP